MKLIIAIVQDQDADRTIQALTKAGHRVTRVASTGGFFSTGNTTLLSGVDESQVQSVIQILKETCERRARLIPAGPNVIESAAMMGAFVEVEIGGATIFVLDVEHFEQT
ncbi:MAG: cyclic-di-AMP receptor [Anaerolineae bacterium]|nr:cyclic-di-AMP receptor [Anaerolineae bacterium]